MVERPQLQQSKAPHAMHTFSDRNFALALARSVLKPRREDKPTSGRHSSYVSHLPQKNTIQVIERVGARL